MKEPKQYQEALKSTQWQSLRKKVLFRDKFECQNCGSKKNLQVHHKEYFIDESNKFFKPHEYPINSLSTLCENCHKKLHQQTKVPVKKYNKMKLFDFFKEKFNSSKNDDEISGENFVNDERYDIGHAVNNATPFEKVAQLVTKSYSSRGFDDANIITDPVFMGDNLEKIRQECIVISDLSIREIEGQILTLEKTREQLKAIGIVNSLKSTELEIQNQEKEINKVKEYRLDFVNGGKFWNSISISYRNGFKEGIVASQK